MEAGTGSQLESVLVVLNNHNSSALIDLCNQIRSVRPGLKTLAACSPAVEAGMRTRLKAEGLTPLLLGPPGGNFTASVNKMAETAGVAPGNARSRPSLMRRVLSWAVNSSPGAFLRQKLIEYRLRVAKSVALDCLKKHRPGAVLSLSDRSHDYVEGPILWAARRLGIPVVLPYVSQFDAEAALKYRRDANGLTFPELSPDQPKSLYKTWAKSRLADQVYQNTFFQAPYVLLASRVEGILSSNPWWLGSGNSDIVCAESQHGAEKYRRGGVPADKIRVTGHVTLDSVYRSHVKRDELRESLRRGFGLPGGMPLVILSMPQFAEQGYLAWPEHWARIREILKGATSPDWATLVSIHPRSDPAEYAFAEAEFGAHILRPRLAEIVGAADLFVASNSTTFSWPALCGIRSVAVWSPVEFLFGFLGSIVPEYDSAALPQLIGTLLNESDFSFEADWAALSRSEVFDGKFAERFTALLETAKAAPEPA